MSEENRKIALLLYSEISPYMGNTVTGASDLIISAFEKSLDEAERRGAEKMRERIALKLSNPQDKKHMGLAGEIRALPLEGPKEGKG